MWNRALTRQEIFDVYFEEEIDLEGYWPLNNAMTDHSGNNRTLKIGNLTGNFDTGESILGQESGASYKLSAWTTDEEGFTANEEIEIAADDIMDFSEGNPFGTP